MSLMQINVSHMQGKVPVTVLALKGEMDASNYQSVVAEAEKIYNNGSRYLLLDMSELSFMSSSGLAGLHMIAVLMRGEEPPDPEYGWAVFHAIEQDRDSGQQQHFKLLSPQPSIERVLRTSGLDLFFEIHTDKAAAIASFATSN